MVHCYTRGLGSSAFARHYSRNHYYFLFLWVLRCFSSPRSLSALSAVTESLPPGFPIRTSAGRRVFAPYRRFSQLVTSFFASESHRHPPCALICFPFSFRLFNRSSSFRLFCAAPLISFVATLSILDSISKLSRILSVSHRIHLFIYVCRFACPSCQ